MNLIKKMQQRKLWAVFAAAVLALLGSFQEAHADLTTAATAAIGENLTAVETILLAAIGIVAAFALYKFVARAMAR